MNNLELSNLRRWCLSHGVDSAHIDSSIGYRENLKALKEMVAIGDVSGKYDGGMHERLQDLERRLERAEVKLQYWKFRAMRAEEKYKTRWGFE